MSTKITVCCNECLVGSWSDAHKEAAQRVESLWRQYRDMEIDKYACESIGKDPNHTDEEFLVMEGRLREAEDAMCHIARVARGYRRKRG